MTQPSLVCPRCRLMDQVQKVSAVVSAGASTGVVVGNTVGTGILFGPQRQAVVGVGSARSVTTGTTQTVIGQRLSPPALPQYERPRGLVTLTIVLSVLGVLLACAGCSLGTLGSGSPNFVWVVVLLFGTPAILALGGAGVAGWFVYNVSQERRGEYAQQYQLWQWAINKWEQLYYCGRDDVVFIPGLQPVPAAYMMDFIYRP